MADGKSKPLTETAVMREASLAVAMAKDLAASGGLSLSQCMLATPCTGYRTAPNDYNPNDLRILQNRSCAVPANTMQSA